ncbi:MAG: VWA domain-containing protein [Proteobacteria bacterium]|nr:VWA domain-containing protein [Pseudomonadota bacterium]
MRARSRPGPPPRSEDTDADGASDLVELSTGTDANDASDNPSERGILALVAPYGTDGDTTRWASELSVQTLDVYLLTDRTASMGGALSQLDSAVSGTLLDDVEAVVPDSQFGLGAFQDFGVHPYGEETDQAFTPLVDLTSDHNELADAVALLEPDGGSDVPESQGPALYATATGDALGAWTAASTCTGDTFGHPCFRAQAIAVVVLITDATSHNDALGENLYSSGALGFDAPVYTEVVTELRDQAVRVVGLAHKGTGLDELLAVATDAVDASGPGAACRSRTAGPRPPGWRTARPGCACARCRPPTAPAARRRAASGG